jgi:hypothetical protein
MHVKRSGSQPMEKVSDEEYEVASGQDTKEEK